MMKKNIFLISLIFIVVAGSNIAQTIHISDAIVWKNLVIETDANGKISEYLSFEGAFSDISTNLPLYSHSIQLESPDVEIECSFASMIFEPFTAEEINYLSNLKYDETSVNVISSVGISRKIPYGFVGFIPIRRNPETQTFEKLVSFSLDISIIQNQQPNKSPNRTYTENSVLNTGDWIKIKVGNSGIYKIGYNDLLGYGLNPSGIDPQTIKLYGNGKGMLPEKNSKFRYDDLQENAIFISGEDDGVFDEQDYILFYGMSPHTWTDILGFYTYEINLYDDYNFYFLTTSQGTGKRIQLQSSSTLPPTRIQTQYKDYQVIEDDEVNLIYSGKKWYGDIFGAITNREYNFNFPTLKPNEQVIVKLEVANRTFINESMAIIINDELSDTIILTSINPSGTKYAQKKKKTINYNGTSGQDINVRLKYLPSTTASTAWLDYIMVNTTNHLKFYNGQFSFRDPSTVMDGAITKFIISDANPDVVVWEITNPLSPDRMETEYSGNEVSFTLSTDILREFIAFDGSKFLIPEFVEPVVNQNLHGEGPFDFIIVTHPLFIDEANQLASIHESLDGFQVKVVTPTEIYNEFSSGKQDPTAIRDYMKMLYDRFEGAEPRFLLLFGDGSFDPKNRLVNNSNFIPTFQTEESWFTSSSYVVEDYFGYLDDNEGEDAIGEPDIGIGRFPVQTKEEASIIMEKIDRYLKKAEPSFGNWRNRICMIADDEDGNLHLEQADSLANGFIPKIFNVNKIYLDAYTQLKTPSGYRYPDVTVDLNEAINNGALIVNYVGHGGKAGWTHERVLQLNDIISWNNKDQLPVFITATCEFSRFDEPELKTGGEQVLLHNNGGGIALLTTTRLAYAQTNFSLNQRVYTTAFSQINGEYPYLGDIIRRSKPPGQITSRNFVLLGDPALKLAYPKYQVRTLSIKNEHTQLPTDTIHALDLIKISGDVADINGMTIESFDGFIQIEVYDKKTLYKTNANDPYSYPVNFFCQDKIIWQGKATVAAGKYEFSFLVPKDIAYNSGPGKISYYAWTDHADAAGYINDFTIGGINQNAQTDVQGPAIELFLNDLSFVSGDQTHENPIMLAFLSDQSGINLSTGGIGHEIIAVLDNDYANGINLQNYYVQDIDTYQRGTINFPFYNLPDGTHTLTLKAWDNYNNSGEKTISFVINTHGPLELSMVYNYPNPFKDYTTFTFDHTRPGDKLDINLSIFDLSGKIVQTYEDSFVVELTHSPFLIWNGNDLQGNKLKSGIYLYTLQVTDEDGNTSVQRQKLVLMN